MTLITPCCSLNMDVRKVLRLTSVEEVTTPKRRRSEIRYSDKQGLERFRAFAEQLYEKRGFEAKIQDLIGGVELEKIVYDSKARTTERNGRDAAGALCISGMAQVALTTSEAFGGELTRRWRC